MKSFAVDLKDYLVTEDDKNTYVVYDGKDFHLAWAYQDSHNKVNVFILKQPGKDKKKYIFFNEAVSAIRLEV